MNLKQDLQNLDSAEEFLDYFQLEYDQRVVHVNRLHILQRFHQYLADAKESLPENEEAQRLIYQKLLARAYQDFVESDALTEKVFKVFHMHQPQTAFVPLDQILK